MKIDLPNELREEVLRVRATLNPGLAPMQLAKLPAGSLAESAATLGKVLDFYLTGVERAYAAATGEFYTDWPTAMAAGRNTPVYQSILTLRVVAHKKQSEQATAGNLELFCALFERALNGQINLNSEITPTTSNQNPPP